MERRTALKNILVFAGAAWFIPSALANQATYAQYFGQIGITEADVTLLAEVMEAIIPETRTPGSKKLGLHLFAMTMIKDCSTKKQQELFIAGLAELDAFSTKTTGVSFTKATLLQKQQLLNTILKDNSSANLEALVSSARELAIQGYNTSEYVLTNLVPYELVPGHYYGCVKVPATPSKRK